MTIEYICRNSECGYSFVDVKIIPKCTCPKCDADTEHYEWDPIAED